MDLSGLKLQDVANIAIFVVPGYFAIQAYASVHAKAGKDFSKLLVESIAFSLPLVGIYTPVFNYIYKHWFGSNPSGITTTDIKYFLPLLIIAELLGFTWAKFRDAKWLKEFASRFGIRGPNDDFIETQFKKLGPDAFTTVTLKNKEIFGGVRAGISSYKKGEPQRCYFNYVKWYDKKTGKWQERDGSLLFNLDDVEYMETSQALPKW